MAELVDFRKELTQLFYDGWTALGNGIPVAWPKREFDTTGKDRYVAFNVNFVDEDRSSIGGVTNWYTQSGFVVIQYFSSVGDEYSIYDDAQMLSDIKAIFRDKETDSVRFNGNIIQDGPIDNSPFSQTNLTIAFTGYLLA